jgi:fructose-bisphosphate aldolase class I
MLPNNMEELYKTAQKLVEGKKGILAADESDNTIKKRFDAISVPSTEETRREYRELLITTPGIEEFISGVILYDETIKQRSHAGIPFPEILSQKGILTGIKVDKGTVDLANFSHEKATEGLDGLGVRLDEYRALGAKFAKWRAVITIGEGIPTQVAIESNAYLLARYAALCQVHGIVPIVEPEVLMDGSHTLDKCREVTYITLKSVFQALSAHRVDTKAMLLKPNMIVSGLTSPAKAQPSDIATTTTKVFAEVIPDELPGVVFLSGGQSPEESTVNLNEINKYAQMKWRATFSFGRALQDPVLKLWNGNAENKAEAQKVFLKRARLNSLASVGQYTPQMEQQP